MEVPNVWSEKHVSNPFRAGGEALQHTAARDRYGHQVSNPFRAGGEALSR